MSTIKRSEEISYVRCRLLRNGAITLAVAAIVVIGSAKAQSSGENVPQVKSGKNTSFGSLKQTDAGLLNVGYVETGPADGPVVILLHRWPYDIGRARYEEYRHDFAKLIWQKRLAESTVITVPGIALEGDANGAPHPDAASYRNKFSSKYAYRLIMGRVGHNLPQEAPQAFAQAVIDVDGFAR